jgi:hypothetical protein
LWRNKEAELEMEALQLLRKGIIFQSNQESKMITLSNKKVLLTLDLEAKKTTLMI